MSEHESDFYQDMLIANPELALGVELVASVPEVELIRGFGELGYAWKESLFAAKVMGTSRNKGIYNRISSGDLHHVILWENDNVSPSAPTVVTLETLENFSGFAIDASYDTEQYQIDSFPYTFFDHFDASDMICRLLIVKHEDFDTDPETITAIVSGIVDVLLIPPDVCLTDEEFENLTNEEFDQLLPRNYDFSVDDEGYVHVEQQVRTDEFYKGKYKAIPLPYLNNRGYVVIGMGTSISNLGS